MKIIKYPFYVASISASLVMPAFAATSADLESFFNTNIDSQMQLCGVCHFPGGLADIVGGNGFLLYPDQTHYTSFYNSWVFLGKGVTNNRLLTVNSDPALSHVGGQNWPTTSLIYQNVETLLTCWDQPAVCPLGATPNSADLSVSMAGNNGQNNGGVIGYSITVTNAGPDTANTLQITNQLPTQVTLSSVAPSSIAYTTNGNEITFYLDSLAAGTSQNIDVTTNTATTNNALMSFSSSVSAVTADANPANNSSTAMFGGGVTTSSADLSVSMAGHNGKNQNGVINYSITVKNSGPADANSLEIVNQLPSQVTLSSVSPSSIVYTSDGNAITFYLDTLVNGDSQSINVSVNTAASNKSKMEFSASVSSATEDTNLANNSSTAKFGGSLDWLLMTFLGVMCIVRKFKFKLQ